MGLRILIADDAPYIREIIRNILSDEDVIFLEDARDGQEAVDIALKEKPDFVFMDLALPKMSGIDASVAILEALPDIRIVAISSLHEPHMIQKALEGGCHDFIKKPFSVEEIIQAVKYQRKDKEVANG